MSKIRRICLYSGPSVGKTTTAAGLFYEFKKLNYNIEYVNEFIKIWSYLGHKPQSWDQFYCLGKQIHKEDTYLSNNVDLIVTDSPILLNTAYSIQYECNYWKLSLKAALMFEEKYPGIHILLTRDSISYDETGRYQNQEQAKEMDNNIKSLLDKYIQYYTISNLDFNQIFSTIIKAVYVS